MLKQPHRVAVIAHHEAVILDLGMPTQAFHAVLDEHGERRYLVELCSLDGEPVTTTAGVTVAVPYDIGLLESADTIVVPGIGAGARHFDPRLLAAIRAAHDRGTRIISICTGAFVLAAAGLLDGKRATTHWAFADDFRASYPKVELDPDALFVDNGSVLTSAGVSAGMDLCLHVIRSDFGTAAASASARRMVMSPVRLGGQSQFIERSLPADDGERLSRTLLWASAHLSEDVSVEALARRASMSVRSVTRHVRAATGLSPAQWVLGQRLGLARELLEQTDLYIDEVARHSGLGTAANLRAQFHRRFAQSPSDYRRAFRAA